MELIREYLSQVERIITKLNHDASLVEEYESHLEAQFNDFIVNNPNIEESDLERKFISQLEDPQVIAKSLIEDILNIEDTTDKISTGFSGKSKRFLASLVPIKESFGKFYQKNPLTSAFMSLFPFLLYLPLIYFYSIFSLTEENVEVSSFFFGSLVIIIIIIVFFYLGLRKSLMEIFLTSVFFTLMLIAIFTLINYPDKLQILTQRGRGSSLVYDWITITNPDLLEYLVYLLSIVINLLLVLPAAIIAIASLGYLTKLIMAGKISLRRKNVKRSHIYQIMFVFICFTILFISPDTSNRLPRTYFNTNANTPPPDPETAPLIYVVTIYPGTSNYDPLSNPKPFTTKIAEFGNFSFSGRSYFNVTFNKNTFDKVDSSYFASFRPIYDHGVSESEFPFPILGVLYIDPENIDDFIINTLNTSFPFEGFEPNLDENTTTIEYGQEGEMITIPVITIRYSSNVNDYQYQFHFDQRTGWLINATLSRINGSWYDNFDGYQDLLFERMFVEEEIDSMNDYRFIEFTFSASIFVLVCSVLTYSYKYYREGKKLFRDNPTR